MPCRVKGENVRFARAQVLQAAAGRSAVVADLFDVPTIVIRDLWARKVSPLEPSPSPPWSAYPPYPRYSQRFLSVSACVAASRLLRSRFEEVYCLCVRAHVRACV